jgi:RNA polymerase subunit RPABC4/transcription elongation factor Spt4
MHGNSTQGITDDISRKTRACLKCRKVFESAWMGERICPHCKGTSVWRNAVSAQVATRRDTASARGFASRMQRS